MSKLRVAVIGCGNIFPVHADAIAANTDAELTAVVDIDKEKAVKAAEKYHCDFYEDYHQLITKEDIDVVHICTPHHKHASIALDFLKAGIDVLTEKPLAIDARQAEEMIATAREYDRSLGVVFQNRFNENVLKAVEILSEGNLGKINGVKGIVTWFRDTDYYQQAEWRGKYSTEGGGVLINQAIHTLDLLQYFAGEVKAIQGNIATRCLGDVIEVEDTADATIFFESGAVGIFFATNCFSSNSPVTIEIDCEKGRLILEGGKLLVEADENCQEYSDNNCSEYKSYWGYGHKTLIDGFYRDVLEGTDKYIVTGQEGIKSLRMLEAIYKSSKSGKREFI